MERMTTRAMETYEKRQGSELDTSERYVFRVAYAMGAEDQHTPRSICSMSM